MDLIKHNHKAQALKKENRIFFDKLKRLTYRNLDTYFQEVHEQVFEKTDCLSCANCCKTTSPIFYNRDVERLAKHFKIKPGDFIERYLKIDEDKDYVLRHAPCPFLDSENYCMVYDDRPNACREYPHTDRKRISQLLDLTYNNTFVCPAVLEMTEQLKKIKL